jgi:hypothetical protein
MKNRKKMISDYSVRRRFFYNRMYVSLNHRGFFQNRRSEKNGKNTPLKTIDENNRKSEGKYAIMIRNVGYPDAVL